MALIEELRCDENIQEALVKAEELTSRLSAKQKETKLKLLEIAFEIRQELFERAREEEEVKGQDQEDAAKEQLRNRVDLLSKLASSFDEKTVLQTQIAASKNEQLDVETVEEIQERGLELATSIMLDIKDLTRGEQIRTWLQKMQNCSKQNFAYFFTLNFEFAKLHFYEAESMESDTFEKANKALTMIQQAFRLLERAQEAAEYALEKHGWSHD